MPEAPGTAFALILAGGRGERLWPLSRDSHPKQFLKIGGDRSLLAQTVARTLPLVGTPDRVLVITRREIERQAKAHSGDARVLAEPLGRNTAPAILLGLKFALALDPEPLLLVFPSDHLVSPQEAFLETLRQGMRAAREGYLVTFGIPPDRPETGYGYIEAGPRVETLGDPPVYQVQRFHEKPDRERAEAYLRQGNFYWNSGMFVFHGPTLLAEFQQHQPDMYRAFEALNPEDPASLEAFYRAMPDLSIDYAILEKSRRIRMVRATFQWEDVGSLDAFVRILPQRDGNWVQGLVAALESKDNVVVAEGQGLVALYGVHDLIVVHTPEVTLVLPRGMGQRVKDLVKRLKADPQLKRFTE